MASADFGVSGTLGVAGDFGIALFELGSRSYVCSSATTILGSNFTSNSTFSAGSDDLFVMLERSSDRNVCIVLEEVGSVATSVKSVVGLADTGKFARRSIMYPSLDDIGQSVYTEGSGLVHQV